MKISPQSIEEVREAADIVEVASEFTALRRQGSEYTGLCPFHQENTPSFSVSPDKGLYYCFGCGAGGDAIELVSQLKGFSFTEAIGYLAERFGVDLQYVQRSPGEARALARRRAAYRALAAAAAYYHKCLRESTRAAPARRYLAERGFNRQTLETFKIGYAPPAGFVRIAGRLNITREALDDAGLLSTSGRDRFFERITFPIADHRGRVIGFGARTLGDAKPKYLNSPETPLFNKRYLLYGLPQAADQIRRRGIAIVVEGYTDVLMLHQCGLRNAVATLGTSITGDHLKRLSGYAERIYLLFDPDEAGEEAIRRAAGAAASMRLDLRVLRLEQDPADWLLRHSAEEFRGLLEEALPVLEYGIRRIAERARGAEAVDRARARPELEGMIREIGDPILRREAVRLASESLGVDARSFAHLLAPGTRGERRFRQTGDYDPAKEAELEVLALILTSPADTAEFLRKGVEVPGLPEPVKPEPWDFSDRARAELFELLRENAGSELDALLASERARPYLDLVSALTLQSRQTEATPPIIRAAWLRLRTLSRERAKRRTGDLDEKLSLHHEIRILKSAISSEEVSAP